MNFFKKSTAHFGLAISMLLGLNNQTHSAEIQTPNDLDSIQLADVIIQIDENQLTQEQGEALNSIRNNIRIRELNTSPSEEVDTTTRQNFNWKAVHVAFNILSDLTALAGSAIFIASPTANNPSLFPISAGMATGYYAIDLFRGFNPILNEIKRDPKSLPSVCAIASAAGQVSSITGLCLLALGQQPIDVGIWLLVGGGITKFLASAASLTVLGIDGTFGNENTITNGIFRVGLLGVGGTVGAVILGSGITVNSPNLTNFGIYTLASTGLIGTTEVLVRDIQELSTLIEQNKQPTPSNR